MVIIILVFLFVVLTAVVSVCAAVEIHCTRRMRELDRLERSMRAEKDALIRRVYEAYRP